MILAIILAGLAQVGPQPVNVQIKNPSFEDAVPVQYQRACGAYTYSGYLGGVFPGGWVSTGTATIIAPISPRPCDFSNPPDGKQMMGLCICSDPSGISSISQDLGDIYTILPHDANGEINGTYAAHVSVANNFYWYRGHFSVSLSIKDVKANPNSPPSGITEILCKTYGYAGGDFSDITLSCPTIRRYGELFITIANDSDSEVLLDTDADYPVLVDKVSLTFTPTN